MCVPPATSYACESWGVRKASASMRKFRQATIIVHANNLRALTGLGKNTPHPIPFAQIPEGPIEDQWVICSANFWNSLCTLPDTSLIYAIWQSAVGEYQHSSSGWVMDLFARLQEVGCPLPLVGTPDPICISLLLQRLELTSRDCYTPVMRACLSPRIFPSRGILPRIDFQALLGVWRSSLLWTLLSFS